jgi:multidrug efflux system outer membrane protein
MKLRSSSRRWRAAPLAAPELAFAAAVVGFVLIGGCAGVLPPKQKPVALSGDAPLEGLEGRGGGEWPAPNWWQRYQDPTLDQLIELGVANSPSLTSAHARFDSARQSVRLAAAAAGAHLDANGDIDRQRLSENSIFSPRLLGFTWYDQSDLGLQATYTFDWWGKQRDAVEAATDQAHAAQAERSAAALVLASSIADTYFGWQADENRLVLAREKESTIAAEGRITAARVDAELESPDDINRSDLELAAARTQIAALEGSARLRVVALAALVARSPADLPPLALKPLPAPPGRLPDDVKIDLISRRADITASRWRVEAAEKNIAAARAEFFPDVTINALAGFSSIDATKLLEYGSRVPQIGAAIHLPMFDQGRLKAQYGGARASLAGAVSAYQDTVITAAREVATQAATLQQLQAERTQHEIAVEAALRMRHTAGALEAQGITDSRGELSATEAWIDQRDQVLELDAEALSADVALQRALGGGYESPPALASAPRQTLGAAKP